MSTKKGKAKVSQADLRKMMQQMKAKKGGPTDQSNQSALKLKQNNGSAIKRTFETGNVKLGSANKRAKASSNLNKCSKTISNNNNGNLKQSTTIKRSHTDSSSSLPSTSNRVTTLEQSSAKIQKLTEVNNKPPTSLVTGFYSDSGSSDEEMVVSSTITNIQSSNNHEATASVSGSKENIVNDKTSSQSSTSALPEGFFDNLEVDAKMRGVETPADKMDREWESFKKQLHYAEDQSEQLIDEEQETGHLDREIEQIDQQIQLYNLVDKLNDQRDTKVKTVNKIKSEIKEESMSSDDEDDVLLNWREKDAFL
ncbi:zinc finger protein 830 [Ciona intestinalis]